MRSLQTGSVRRCVPAVLAFACLGWTAWTFGAQESVVPPEFPFAECSGSTANRTCDFGLAIGEIGPTVPDLTAAAGLVAPAGGKCGDILLSQTHSDTVTGGVACSLQAPDFSFCASDANSFARSFNLAADSRTAGKGFAVDCVEFGVRDNITLNNPDTACQPNGPGGDYVVGVNVYRDTNGGAPTNHGVDLELLGGTGVVIPFGTQSQGFGVTFDPAILVPADSRMVLEVFAPTRLLRFGGDGGLFAAGFNSQPQTAPAYLKAPNCGQNSFTSMSSLLPGASLVLHARGHIQSLEFVDPAQELLVDAGPGAGVHEFINTSDYTRLATRGRAVSGAAADGITPVLMRAKVNGPGSVQFDLSEASGTGENIGTLRRLDGSNVGSSVTSPVEFFSTDGFTITYMAFVLYYAPTDFCSSPSAPAASLVERAVRVGVTYLPQGGGPAEDVDVRHLKVVRPGVVLLHGLHDYGNSWHWFFLHDPRFEVVTPDYSSTHGDHFFINRRVLRHAVAEVVQRVRNKGFAATAADAFGHSMGGLLSRFYTTNQLTVDGKTYTTNYRRADNFYLGDVHKLTSVNTPHYGSPVSDMLVGPYGDNTLAGTIAQQKTGRCINCGAVFDLRTDSAVVAALNAAFVPLPVHALWGDGAAVTPDFYYTAEKAFPAKICDQTLQTLMSGDSDAVVPVLSQRVGLPPTNRSLVTGAEGLHWPTIGDFPAGPSAVRAVELLNTATTDPAFAGGFPTFFERLPLGPICHLTLLGPSVAQAGGVQEGIEIVDPAPGAVAPPGSVVTVRAQVIGPFAPNLVALFMVDPGSLADQSVELTSPPFEADFVVPATHVGPLRFVAIGVDADSRVAVSEPVFLDVQTSIAVTSVSVSPASVFLYAYAPTTRLSVTARFADGLDRVVTVAGGVSFQSADATIASADAEGLVTAHRVGATTLTVIFAGQSAPVAVSVLGVKGDADLNGGIDLSDAAHAVACHSGPGEAPGASVPSVFCLDFFDTDADDDVDLVDIAEFQNEFTAGQ